MALSLTERMMKSMSTSSAAVLNESILTQEKTVVGMPVLAMNIACSGRVRGGYYSGVTQWAGPSRHFKTMFGLIQVRAYLEEFPDAICILYDSEFGAPMSYFESVGIDTSRVLHVPVLTLEELRHEMVNQLKEIKRGDRVIMMVDSVGNLASKKETEDAESGKEAADLTRAKVAKSFFRIVTPHFSLKDIPLVVINHTYQTLEIYSKSVTGGGTGSVYASDSIFHLGRRQTKKPGKDLEGYEFIINVDKSRYIREKTSIPIGADFEDGISRYAGIFDLGQAAGLIQPAKKGYYFKVDPETGEVDDKQYPRSKIEADSAFMKKMAYSDKFDKFLAKEYRLGSGDLVAKEDDEGEE